MRLNIPVIIAGGLPVSAIAMHVLGIVSLDISSLFIVLPVWMCLIVAGMYNPDFGRKLVCWFLCGIFAVAVYDLSRIPFMYAGWGDFIPGIGDWLLGTENTHPLVGYGWRYIGNGGGLGIAFGALHKLWKDANLISGSVFYGVTIWMCLDIVLMTAPGGESMMFEMTALNVIGSLVGHVVFGLTLGLVRKSFDSTTALYSPLASE